MSHDTATASSNEQVRNKAKQLIQDESASTMEIAVELVKEYARERPEIVAAWAFGIGFVLGWKLKPW